LLFAHFFHAVARLTANERFDGGVATQARKARGGGDVKLR
jgi:hypothetical protein